MAAAATNTYTAATNRKKRRRRRRSWRFPCGRSCEGQRRLAATTLHLYTCGGGRRRSSERDERRTQRRRASGGRGTRREGSALGGGEREERAGAFHGGRDSEEIKLERERSEKAWRRDGSAKGRVKIPGRKKEAEENRVERTRLPVAATEGASERQREKD